MFKKLIILVLIALLTIPAITGCSSNKEQPAPPANAAIQEKPTAPTTSPTTQTTPSTEKSSGSTKAISRIELIEQVEKGEYGVGDIVLLSGIVMGAGLDGKGIPSDKVSLADFVWLGPDTGGPVVRIKLAKEQKVKIGEKIIVKGTLIGVYYTEISSGTKHLNQISIGNAVIQ